MSTLDIIRPFGHKDAGHQQLQWQNEVEFRVAQAEFIVAQEQGYVAVETLDDGATRVVSDLKPDAKDVTMFPMVAGG